MVLIRRILAGVLVLLAVVLAVLPAGPSVDVVVAARDLPPGVPLTGDDVRVASLPPPLVPSGAVSRAEAVGRALVSAARSGEPLTDARLAPGSPETSSVAVRLADPGVVGLLRPGSRVDVVGAGAHVLASDASVVAVRDGEVVVVSADRAAARRIAAESLAAPVALTLR
ncbi:SAF domain-containing protein [Saccharothrix longispora]|uniref:Flp pilus assembly protein CpaB n=1 Tax=Saccharothrix longispora TaxID=33920 RepID=A0ABU1Q574_9PSEU|nr:SAF domain-containing protein [Saccharothrix longispora]MDR6598023.1 Flp pilus assembly protein CpaB [Saccharothrix longispora]